MLGIDTTTIANWRSGLAAVTPRTQAILDTTLEQRATPEDRARFEQIVAEGQTVWRERHTRTAPRTPIPPQPPQPPDSTTTSPAPSTSSVEGSSARAEGGDPVERKAFLQVMTGSAAGLILGASSLRESHELRAAAEDESLRTPKGAPTTPELTDYFRAQLTGHYTADASLGPLHLIPTVHAQTELIIGLASRADSRTRADLLHTGAAYAALLGWLHQDAGDLATSTKWRHTTLSLAHRCGDPQIISYALSNMAMLALDQYDGRVVVEYARAARAAGPALSPKCRVIALQHEAHGHAMLADRATADRLLDDVAALIPRVDDHHPWGNAYRRTLYHVEVQRAISYGRTGKTRDATDAAALWDEIIDSLPESGRRDNAVFRARQSTALAKIPDPERAVWAATEAATALKTTGSARLRRELEAIPSQAGTWAHTSAGDELRAIVGSLV